MLRFLLRRVLLGIPVLVAVATLTFLIMHWVPGGPFDTEKILPPAIIANIEAKEVIINKKKGIDNMEFKF